MIARRLRGVGPLPKSLVGCFLLVYPIRTLMGHEGSLKRASLDPTQKNRGSRVVIENTDDSFYDLAFNSLAKSIEVAVEVVAVKGKERSSVVYCRLRDYFVNQQVRSWLDKRESRAYS
jgi:hypothetical protein